jgi:hypothetical protein
LIGFGWVDGRAVVAKFAGGAITSDIIGGLLLRVTDRTVRSGPQLEKPPLSIYRRSISGTSSTVPYAPRHFG